ncbi:MAG: hypothetical protein ACP5NI_04130 [Acetobacteraceae bacterium]
MITGIGRAGWRTGLRGGLLAVAGLLLGSCAAGMGGLHAGQVVSERVGFAGVVFPLPPGPWRVVYAGLEQQTKEGGAVGDADRGVVLASERAGHAVALVYLHVVDLIGRGYWHRPPICTSTTALWVASRGNQGAANQNSARYDCAWIYALWYPGGKPASPQAVDIGVFRASRGRPGWLAHRYIEAGVGMSVNAYRIARVLYIVDPAALGRPGETRGGYWWRGGMSAGQQAFVAGLRSWIEASWPAIRRGIRGGENVGPLGPLAPL